MTQATIQVSPEAPVAPPTGPIELGPDVSHYPEQIRTIAEPATPVSQAAPPESSEPGASAPPPADAGSSQESPTGDAATNSRRQKGEDAYQRGLREGRETADRDRTERDQADARQKATADEQARIRQLFRDLRSPDYDTRSKAGEELSGLVDTHELNQSIELRTRTAVLNEIAGQFQALGQLEGIGEEGHKALLAAQSPDVFARTAFDLGVKHAKAAADERIAELEAQLQAERGKRAGSSLTPDRQNGSNGTGGRLTLEQYQRMSARELKAAGITSADIDALTAEMLAEGQRNRS